MCMISTTNKPTIAEKDIICYKLVTKSHIFNGIVTPYRTYPVGEDVLSGEKPLKPWGSKSPVKLSKNAYSFTKGWIHVYSERDRAISFAAQLRCAVYECRIPTGSNYFTSKHGYTKCASEIFFNKLIYNPDNVSDSINA